MALLSYLLFVHLFVWALTKRQFSGIFKGHFAASMEARIDLGLDRNRFAVA